MKKLEEIKKKVLLQQSFDEVQMYNGIITLPDTGDSTVVWGYDENGYEHVSVAPLRKVKIPTWEDMAYLKDVFFEDEEECYQIMPPKSQYVNIKGNCLHIWRPTNGLTLDVLKCLKVKED